MGISYSLLSGPEDLLKRAEKYVQNKKYDDAIQILDEIKDINDDACLLLAKIYMAAYEYNKAKPLFEKIDNKYQEASYNLGLMYYHGYGVDINKNKAFEYFSSSKDLNYPPTIYMLGQCFEKGYGIPKDTKTAKKYYKQGIELNNPSCMVGYAMLCKEKDINKCIKYLERGVRLDNIDAYYQLGKIYYKKNQATIGLTYLKIAANKNHVRAMLFLIEKYMQDGINGDEIIKYCKKIIDMECTDQLNTFIYKLKISKLDSYDENFLTEFIKLLIQTDGFNKINLRWTESHIELDVLINNIKDLYQKNKELKSKLEIFDETIIYQLSNEEWNQENERINRDKKIYDGYIRKRYVALIKNYVILKNENDQLNAYFAGNPNDPEAPLFKEAKESWYKEGEKLGKPIDLTDDTQKS